MIRERWTVIRVEKDAGNGENWGLEAIGRIKG
jgi:hypothetical protein